MCACKYSMCVWCLNRADNYQAPIGTQTQWHCQLDTLETLAKEKTCSSSLQGDTQKCHFSLVHIDTHTHTQTDSTHTHSLCLSVCRLFQFSDLFMPQPPQKLFLLNYNTSYMVMYNVWLCLCVHARVCVEGCKGLSKSRLQRDAYACEWFHACVSSYKP